MSRSIIKPINQKKGQVLQTKRLEQEKHMSDSNWKYLKVVFPTNQTSIA